MGQNPQKQDSVIDGTHKNHRYMLDIFNKEKTEEWTAKLPQRDWAALEHTWSTANSAKGGEVVG